MRVRYVTNIGIVLDPVCLNWRKLLLIYQMLLTMT